MKCTYILCTNDFSVIISFYRTKMHISLFIKTHWFQKTQIQVYLIVTLRDKSKVVYTFWAILAVRQYRRRAYTAVFVRSVFSDTVLITLTLRNPYIQYHSTVWSIAQMNIDMMFYSVNWLRRKQLNIIFVIPFPNISYTIWFRKLTSVETKENHS